MGKQQQQTESDATWVNKFFDNFKHLSRFFFFRKNENEKIV